MSVRTTSNEKLTATSLKNGSILDSFYVESPLYISGTKELLASREALKSFSITITTSSKIPADLYPLKIKLDNFQIYTKKVNEKPVSDEYINGRYLLFEDNFDSFDTSTWNIEVGDSWYNNE